MEEFNKSYGVSRFKILKEISNEKMYREFQVDYKDFNEEEKIIENEIDTLSIMEKAKNF